MKINTVYNCHFSGSSIWNIFSAGAKNLEVSFNRSVMIMCSLPYETNRYLVKPLSGGLGLGMQLVKKYLGFVKGIKKSSRLVLQQLLNLTKQDV